jgi:phosphomannomutase
LLKQGHPNNSVPDLKNNLFLMAVWYMISGQTSLRSQTGPSAMIPAAYIASLFEEHVAVDDHVNSDYFALLRKLVAGRNRSKDTMALWQEAINRVYALLDDEIRNNHGTPVNPVKFGTSGWRGQLGKDLFSLSVSQVCMAIIELYSSDPSPELGNALGIRSFEEARERGCVLGFDNRYGGELLAGNIADILTGAGFIVHYAGESTTGVLSAALLELNAAFSINLTPSHNPLEYGGFKFNAADGGPAAEIITSRITANATRIIEEGRITTSPPRPELINKIDALAVWQDFVRKGSADHHLDYDQVIARFFENENIVVAIDSVHGASRVHIPSLFNNRVSERLLTMRDDPDPTFGGIAPEPSTANMQHIRDALATRPEPLKLGMIIDPDADRIRFNDGTKDIEMNQFGAAAYHYLHEHKNKSGLVAKSVATSNFANSIADGLGEETFETRVGFKEFKPVIGKALVFFEESDGISIIGHTPEKDAYIGLLLALDMTMTLGKPLGEYIGELEAEFGAFYPDRGGIEVSSKGDELNSKLTILEKYQEGSSLLIGTREMTISKVINIDGRKMIMEDGSWLMIRPSGTEPKVRYYLEARSRNGMQELREATLRLLGETGLLP